jgi:alpha-L-fucosidase
MSQPAPTPDTAKDQHALIGVPASGASRPAGFLSNPHPDAAWFREGNFGLFIHWGISTVHGGIDLSWGMMAGAAYDLGVKITPREYFDLAPRFQPDRYDPLKWLSAAKAAGVNHAIFTTKHHDGFALWPSAFGDFNTRRWLGGRDFVREYVEACRALDLKVGLYYSPPDWHYNRERMSFCRASTGQEPVPHLDIDHRPYTPPEPDPAFDRDFHAYLRGQIEELLINYGKIDLLFFDGRPEVISFDRIRELQPGILVNERMHGYGDFGTPECHVPEQAPNPPWETVDVWDIAGRWGYAQPFMQKPPHMILWNLCRCLAMRGNYMVNVGPLANGDLPAQVYKDFGEIQKWMEWAAPALRNFTPWKNACRFPINEQGNTLYVFVPPLTYQLIGLEPIGEPVSITLLRTGEPLAHAYMPRYRLTPKLNIVPPAFTHAVSTVEIIKIVRK